MSRASKMANISSGGGNPRQAPPVIFSDKIPVNPDLGQIYINSDSNKVSMWDGNNWITVSKSSSCLKNSLLGHLLIINLFRNKSKDELPPREVIKKLVLEYVDELDDMKDTDKPNVDTVVVEEFLGIGKIMEQFRDVES
jgi:hypothetical protein